jgi:hypothetical protein
MTRLALLQRSLVASADCPRCGRVYLGDFHRAGSSIVDWGVTPMVPYEDLCWWDCEHLAPDGVHRWRTGGLIEVRPVRALHIEVQRRG